MTATKNTHIILMLSLILFIPMTSMTQIVEDQNEYQESFDSFKNSMIQDFDAFKQKNDSIFFKFLEQSWVKFNLFKEARPTEPKPQEQPVMRSVPIENTRIDPIKPWTILEDSGRQMILNGKPPVYKKKATYDKPSGASISFDFYGTPIEIEKPKMIEKDIRAINGKEIAETYKNMSNDEAIHKTIRMLESEAEKQHLNGWGTLDLFRTASTNLYASTNERVLFTWFALLRMGFEARVGYDEADVYLLVAFDAQAFYRPYFELKGIKYYLVSFSGQSSDLSSITSYEVDYPEKLSYLTLYFDRYPEIAFKPGYRTVNYQGEEVRLAYNKNLTDFYSSYPEIDLSVYFQPCISADALGAFEPFIRENISKTTEEQRINFFLDFIQQAFGYQTDEQQFGSENYLFAEETLRYPFSDCEDRTVLLDQFLKAFTKVQTIAIVYPGHVLLGVSMAEPLEGTYVAYDGKKFYVADPTYVGAKLGMIMPEFKQVKPEIIDIQKLEKY